MSETGPDRTGDVLLTIKQQREIFPVSETTHWRYEKLGLLGKKVVVNGRPYRWRSDLLAALKKLEVG